MDGNGRWAKRPGFERFFGHRKGTQATIDAVEVGVDLKLEHLTLYVFSSENWGRPSKEVDYLMKLLVEMVAQELPHLMEKQVKLIVIGNMDRLPKEPRIKLEEAINKIQESLEEDIYDGIMDYIKNHHLKFEISIAWDDDDEFEHEGYYNSVDDAINALLKYKYKI